MKGKFMALPCFLAALIFNALARLTLMSFRFRNQPETSSGKRLRQVCAIHPAHKMSFASSGAK
jgi:hypothetical protein